MVIIILENDSLSSVLHPLCKLLRSQMMITLKQAFYFKIRQIKQNVFEVPEKVEYNHEVYNIKEINEIFFEKLQSDKDRYFLERPLNLSLASDLQQIVTIINISTDDELKNWANNSVYFYTPSFLLGSHWYSLVKLLFIVTSIKLSS